MQITLDLIAFALEVNANSIRFGVTPGWAVYMKPLPRRHEIEPVRLPNWVFTPFMPASYRTRVNRAKISTYGDNLFTSCCFFLKTDKSQNYTFGLENCF